MIETECFKELNVMEVNGVPVADLRPLDSSDEALKMSNNNKPSLFARIFKREVYF